jgi:hypothetical protein
MRLGHAVLLVLALGFAGCGGCGRTGDVGATKEILSESMEKVGDTWKVNITSRIEAPPERVYEVFTQLPERAHDLDPAYALKSELVSQEGNTKVVDLVGKLDVLPPGFKVQSIRNEWTMYPNEKRITSKSIDFKQADIASEYRFEPTPDGKGTVVTFISTSKDKQPMLVESLQKGAIRELYVRTIQNANKALGLAQPAAQAPAG